MAFCSALAYEASVLSNILESHGFEVVAVTCKAGGVPKEAIRVKDREKVRIGQFESMCNPITQAKILNQAKTDFNIMLGLCIGHDSLFLKYLKGLTTGICSERSGHRPQPHGRPLHFGIVLPEVDEEKDMTKNGLIRRPSGRGLSTPSFLMTSRVGERITRTLIAVRATAHARELLPEVRL